ncbi:MAG TPA: hypothetical protein DEB40_02025 [Elusimicrobia bacterium]|nr:hypothetical protein [Elusimicrobiota bacterium]HBT60508.1 hypothetical protein [Elusimicrobiota bacterium]
MSTVTIKKDNDPFKKYWWAILAAFAAVGGWVCMPLMDSSVGSGVAIREGGLKSAEQSLDSVANPSGAPGQAVDLAMQGSGAYRKKNNDEPVVSSLYQAPADNAAAGAPLSAGGTTASASFAAALKEVSKKTDPGGWGGAAVHRAFIPPKGNFGGLSGLGSGGSGSSGAALSVGAFGTAKPNTGLIAARGLGAMEPATGARSGSIISSLRAAQAQGAAAANQRSGDAAKAMAAASFDGRGAGSSISGGQGQSVDGAYVRFDAVPMNLKVNDPNLNSYKYEGPAEAVAETDTSAETKRQLAIMLAGVLVGGIVGGTAGNMISMAMMMYSATQGRSTNSGSNVTGQTTNKTSFVPSRRQYGPAVRYA